MIKILPIPKVEPHFVVTIGYMIGDANGHTNEVFECSREELEEVSQYILILNKLERLKGHWGICFDNYPEEYPGEYIGLTEEEYDKFYEFINSEEGYEFGIRSDAEYSFLVFEGIDVTYIDENNAVHDVVISDEEED